MGLKGHQGRLTPLRSGWIGKATLKSKESMKGICKLRQCATLQGPRGIPRREEPGVDRCPLVTPPPVLGVWGGVGGWWPPPLPEGFGAEAIPDTEWKGEPARPVDDAVVVAKDDAKALPVSRQESIHHYPHPLFFFLVLNPSGMGERRGGKCSMQN